MYLSTKFQFNIIIALLLVMIYYHANYKLLKNSFINRLFLSILPITILALTFECLIDITSEYNLHILILLNKTFHIMNIILIPFIVYLWIMHIGEWFSRYEGLHMKPKKILKYPLFILTFFSLFFKVDKNNIYSLGSMYLLPYLLILFYITYIFLYIRLMKKSSYEKEVNLFSLILLIAFVGVISEIIFKNSFSFISQVGTLLIVNYVFLQNLESQYDPLTNALNRLAYEQYLKHLNLKNKNCNNISIINFDLDDFKSINDTYGHTAGDNALKTFCSALYKVNMSKKVFRIGGDEFVVIIENTSLNSVKKYILSFENIMEDININLSPFSLHYSYGISNNRKKDYDNINSMIENADKLMYEQKYDKQISRKYNLT